MSSNRVVSRERTNIGWSPKSDWVVDSDWNKFGKSGTTDTIVLLKMENFNLVAVRQLLISLSS